ncbi:thiamine pyrophosphate-dependent dehydrogenase E1 component subunit alpha [Rickettsiales endosymbiont of Stachyamoeba lipophora]|uniref:thiamine pyrophosphate-dependent dehydrogenase E1 component subunit alpha n=1 Tax=Rickettsiales endosymbiont of Stachyamoeba lipophora TaxID=2486578 RepID=UPI000F64EB80|nr:thiamine pyrophosphate-dependent dehydrogenase E1 component subunit alpha [Rickettsiales endosymbiont of Stachyamoeba lipophora]AZL15719.1 thiamine pyrophosphate-dependent dehydrogenase E1 component subunit alpha [Rickettsiales endosymbiont of Stachyamoeba lipophora]
MQTNLSLVPKLYYKTLLIREVEEFITKIYFTDNIKSPVHLSIGQEAVAAAICDVMQEKDLISNTYRCHATYIAKGGNLKEMMAELYGKKTGCAGGKAGSMHLIDMANGVLGASAVVGTTIPVATGFALSFKQRSTPQVVVAMFGDGATEEGCFTESINFAALHKLPILFVCENNGYAIHNPIENRWPKQNIVQRVATYGLITDYVYNGDIFEMRDKTASLLERVRAGEGPAFIEIKTYRYKEHVGPNDDIDEIYRDIAEYQKWREIDQIDRLAGMLPEAIRTQIEQQVNAEIEEAVKFAEQSPYPTEKDLYNNVYA